MLTRENLQKCTIPEMKQFLERLQVDLPTKNMKKDQIIQFILDLRINMCKGCHQMCYESIPECGHFNHKTCATTNNEGFLSCPECFIHINLTTNELEEMYNLQQAKHLT